jgi:GTPase Era involved in 16S rRNA processing
MVETMSTEYPKFAVVGHPNKGKSSIVSVLALDDTVQISDTPGSTVRKQSFPLKVDGKILYELFDTPGFQRARRVLSWLQKHDVSADKRHEVVQAFIDAHREDERFRDEIELLEPIMEGAGIIYVVDASKPYGEEYEAEMEILRWTGQPSMALINHIDETDYSREWKRALGQYFKMVRSFNPMQASFSQHLSLLESIAQLNEEWIAPVNRSIALFKRFHSKMLEQSAAEISRLMYHSLSYVERYTLHTEKASEADERKVEERYKERLRRFEKESQQRIEAIWQHKHLKKEQELLLFEGLDLFSEQSASIFGLTRKELLVTAATGGAVTGAGIDLLFAGHTLLLGGAIGAVIGGAGAYFGFNELADVKVLGQHLGKHSLETGPMKNRNFPYILLGRALYHMMKVINRSHAVRSVVEVSMESSFKEQWLDETLRTSLEKYHKMFRSGKEVENEVLQQYSALIKRVLENFDREAGLKQFSYPHQGDNAQ